MDSAAGGVGTVPVSRSQSGISASVPPAGATVTFSPGQTGTGAPVSAPAPALLGGAAAVSSRIQSGICMDAPLAAPAGRVPLPLTVGTASSRSQSGMAGAAPRPLAAGVGVAPVSRSQSGVWASLLLALVDVSGCIHPGQAAASGAGAGALASCIHAGIVVGGGAGAAPAAAGGAAGVSSRSQSGILTSRLGAGAAAGRSGT
jgi:hypothetical protein